MLEFCRRERLFEPESRVLVAVSGGADSLCLLSCLHALRSELLIDLYVAHIHHGLRAEAADDDEAFVAGVAAALELPFSVDHIDVRACRRAGESTEAAARRLRYGALRRIAARDGLRYIAVGHSMDDRAETVVLNLLRGAGIDGLSAMRPREADVVRPLLGVSRRLIESYIGARGYAPRVDSTNFNPAYRRNAIRAHVLPILEQYNPRIRQTLARSAHALALDADYLDRESVEALGSARLPSAEGNLVVDRRILASLHPGLRAHVLRHALHVVSGSLDGVRMEHVRHLMPCL